MDKLLLKYIPILTKHYSEYIDEFFTRKRLNLGEPKILSNDFNRILKLEDYSLMKSLGLDNCSKLFDTIDFLKSQRGEASRFHADIHKEIGRRLEIQRNQLSNHRAEIAILKARYITQEPFISELNLFFETGVKLKSGTDQINANIQIFNSYNELLIKHKDSLNRVDFLNEQKTATEIISNLTVVLDLFETCKNGFENYLRQLKSAKVDIEELKSNLKWR